jgi:hypothetical protein
MAYRRNSQKAHSWRQWLLKNKTALDECGIPEFIPADELSWWSFLEPGFYGNHHDLHQFRLEDLSEKQLQALYTFLDMELSADKKTSSMVFTSVKSRLNKIL